MWSGSTAVGNCLVAGQGILRPRRVVRARFVQRLRLVDLTCVEGGGPSFSKAFSRGVRPVRDPHRRVTGHSGISFVTVSASCCSLE